MRITDRWDLENKEEVRKAITEGLINDIIKIANKRFNSAFTVFEIKFKIKEINKFESYD